MDFDKLSNAGEMSKQIEATAEKAILRLIRTHHMAAESIQAAMEAIDTEANQKNLKQEWEIAYLNGYLKALRDVGMLTHAETIDIIRCAQGKTTPYKKEASPVLETATQEM